MPGCYDHLLVKHWSNFCLLETHSSASHLIYELAPVTSQPAMLFLIFSQAGLTGWPGRPGPAFIFAQLYNVSHRNGIIGILYFIFPPPPSPPLGGRVVPASLEITCWYYSYQSNSLDNWTVVINPGLLDITDLIVGNVSTTDLVNNN